jgi:hypothetical protein
MCNEDLDGLRDSSALEAMVWSCCFVTERLLIDESTPEGWWEGKFQNSYLVGCVVSNEPHVAKVSVCTKEK